MSIKLILLVIAIICFVIQAFGVPTWRVSIGWIGMAFLAGAFLV